MVGRLVKQQQVGFLHKRSCQGDSSAPSAREFTHLFVGGQVEVAHRCINSLVYVPAVVRVDFRVQRFKFCQSVLVEILARHFLVLFQ